MNHSAKRALAGLLLILMCLALAGCGAPQQSVPAPSCREIADQIQAACAFAGLTDVPENYMEKHLLIDAADLEEWVMRRDTSGASPEMILVVKVKRARIRRQSKRPWRNTGRKGSCNTGIISPLRCSSWKTAKCCKTAA